MLRTSQKGRDFIESFEARKLTAYLCQAGIPTIGVGNISSVTMDDVRNGKTITNEECERLFSEDLADTERMLNRVLTLRPNQGQFDALMSLAFNIGDGGFMKSSALRAHNRGDFVAAARAITLWNKIKHPRTKKLVVSNGLVRRRGGESANYREASFPVADEVIGSPQAVFEQPLTSSGITRGAGATGVVASLAAVSELADQGAMLKSTMASVVDPSLLSQYAMPLLLLTVVGLAGFIFYERWKQRAEGFA